MSVYWSRGIAGLEPYVPGEQPRDRKYVKLNTNESPYPPSPKVLEAIRDAADGDLRLYPDPECSVLRRTIARRHGLGPEEVFIGNGSDEILAFAFAAFLDHGDPVLFPDISYSFYPVYADFFRLPVTRIPLRDDFSIPVEEFFVRNGGIVLCNPNAPTSRALPAGEIVRLLEWNLAHGRIVLVDEAYVDFGAESVAGLVRDWPNLLVVQTFSKSRSLAGLRVGFALGSGELVEGLERVKSSFNSYTVDRPALAGAVAAFEDEEYFQAMRARIVATRDRVSAALRDRGFDVPGSSANFVFIRHPEVDAATFYGRLRSRGILVRHFRKARIDDRLRVSIGTDGEMDAFLAAVDAVLADRAGG